MTGAKGEKLTAVTALKASIETAKEVATSIDATTGEKYLTILTDSQAAIRNFLIGRISQLPLATLQQVKQILEIHIVWSRGHTHRSVSQEEADFQAQDNLKPTSLQKYADILAQPWYGRQQYPALHPKLFRAEATIFR